MLTPTYTLTVDLATLTGADVPGINISVELADPRLIYPLGIPTETLYPTAVNATTDIDGVAQFSLLPSSEVGDYRIQVGGYERIITMPGRDIRFSEIGQVAPPGGTTYYVGWASPAQPGNAQPLIAASDFATAHSYIGDSAVVPVIGVAGDYLWFARTTYPGHVRFNSLQGRDVLLDFDQQAGTLDYSNVTYFIGVGKNRSSGSIAGHDIFFED